MRKQVLQMEIKEIDIMTASKKDFQSLPYREWNEDVGEFDSLVILPTKRKHDSGYRVMDCIAVREGKAFCKLTGCSDAIHIDGIGGYGKDWVYKYKGCPKMVPSADWNIDCLPKSGLLNLWCRKKLTAGDALSSFEIFHKEE